MSRKNYTSTQDSNSTDLDYRNIDLLKALNIAMADGGGEPLLNAVIKVILTGKVDVASTNVQRILSERLDPKDFRALKERLMTDNLDTLAASHLVTNLLGSKGNAVSNASDKVSKEKDNYISTSDQQTIETNNSSNYSYDPNSSQENNPKGPQR